MFNRVILHDTLWHGVPAKKQRERNDIFFLIAYENLRVDRSGIKCIYMVVNLKVSGPPDFDFIAELAAARDYSVPLIFTTLKGPCPYTSIIIWENEELSMHRHVEQFVSLF